VQEAITQLTEIYQLDTVDVTLLNSANFEIVDLDDLTLGYTSGTTVQIDINAAGHGWFVDTTPSDDIEFTRMDNGSLLADSSSSAYDQMDLLTVVMHELGHVLSYEDVDSQTSSCDLMSDVLTAGVRRCVSEPVQIDVRQDGLDDDFSTDPLPQIDLNDSLDLLNTADSQLSHKPPKQHRNR
jgi:hypothetical protein